MQENKQILVQIPFGGFYCSIWGSEIDFIESTEIEHYNLEHNTEKTWNDFEIDYETIRNEISKNYCHYWSQQLSQNVSFNIGEDLEVYFNFESLVSPRYYNFETDRIFAYCDFEKFKELYDRLAKYGFKEWLFERMKPCSGFIPHYSNCLEDWGDLENWDFNQYGLFLEWLDGQYVEDWKVLDDMLEIITITVMENMKLKEN